MTLPDTIAIDRRERDHALQPQWLTEHDPLPQPINGRREEYVSLCRRMIAANAIRRYREDGEDGRVSYSRNKNWYLNQDRKFYWLPWFTYDYVTRAVDQMDAARLIFHDRKKQGNRYWQSWFLALPKLLEQKTKLQHIQYRNIIMRDEDKNDVAYNEKAKAFVKMNGDAEEINAYLSKQIITLYGKVLKEGDPLYVDLHCVTGAIRIALRRIFNDRSFYKGGRFFNDVQGIPKSARQWMTLNGHPVKHYDYSAFYPGLLYALAGTTCDGDPYTVEGWPRQITKPILNIVLNAKTGTAAVRAAAQDMARRLGGTGGRYYDKARAIIAALKKRNEPIAEFFHNDVGKYLMLHESRLLESNMQALMKLEIPFVPLHDALLVPEHKLPVLELIMEDNLAMYQEMLTEGGRKLRNRGANLDDDVSAISTT